MFAKTLRSKQVFFKYAKGCRDVFGKEFHAFHEIFLLIGDMATFASDNLIDTICAMSLVIIPKHQFHQFDHIGEEENYHRYVLQFDGVEGLEEVIASVCNRVKLIRNTDPATVLIFKKMEQLFSDHKTQYDKQILLDALFTELLIDLKYRYAETAITKSEPDPTISKILEFIHTNYTSDLTIRTIAEHLNFSETYVSHKFKQVMHISVYKYILQKRLMHAYSLISSGELPTYAAEVCGFDNYSGFYKMYKNYLGFPPSKTKKNIYD